MDIPGIEDLSFSTYHEIAFRREDLPQPSDLLEGCLGTKEGFAIVEQITITKRQDTPAGDWYLCGVTVTQV